MSTSHLGITVWITGVVDEAGHVCFQTSINKVVTIKGHKVEACDAILE